MPLASGFTLRFFEFSIAVAVVDRSRLGPETNVYLGIARARTCERTTIAMIDGRPRATESTSAIYLFIFVFVFGLRLESLEVKYKFQRALRPKKRRGPANCLEEGCNKWLIILWMGNPFRAWEVILLVTTLSLCSILVFCSM